MGTERTEPCFRRRACRFRDNRRKAGSVDRELEAIESEFREIQNEDEPRVERLFGHSAREGHCARNFGYGDLRTLREIPRKAGIDVHGALRAFHATYYKAPFMRLCVYGVG